MKYIALMLLLTGCTGVIPVIATVSQKHTEVVKECSEYGGLNDWATGFPTRTTVCQDVVKYSIVYKVNGQDVEVPVEKSVYDSTKEGSSVMLSLPPAKIPGKVK